MSSTAKNYLGTAADEDIVEVLTAISVVSEYRSRQPAESNQGRRKTE